MAEYRDEDWPEAPDFEQPDPEKGKYLLSFMRSRKIERFSRQKIELDFVIIKPREYEKKTVKMYFALPSDGPISPESKYFGAWCQANGGPPKRGDRMTPYVFHGYWWAELGYTQRKATREGKLRKLEEGEKGRVIVSKLIEREAGAPLVSARRSQR